LIRYLKTHQRYDQSTIVLLSDHGQGLGDHGEQGHGLFVYDEAIHVPLIIKQESNAGAGRRVSDVAQQIDMVPTILDLVKAPAPGDLRGRSLKPLLEGTGQLRDRFVYAEALYAHNLFGWSELRTVTDGRYQYIQAPREELFDLTRDPHEHENLAGQNADTTRAAAALKAFGSLTAEAAESAADPKDKWEILERYRTAVNLVGQRKWADAITMLQGVLHEEPEVAQFWSELASVSWLATRYDVALDAYRHLIDLEPSDPAPHLGAADVLLKERKFDEASGHATEAADLSADTDTRSRASAHALLARIALARRNPDAARDEAALAFKADPQMPMPPFVEGRILYDQGKYDEAWVEFEAAVAAAREPGATPIADLHFYAGDTLVRLERREEAEAEFADELKFFPRSVRARASLATLYHASGQAEAADTAVSDLLRIVPTPESYTAASRLLQSFGKRRQAEAVRAEAGRTFPPSRQ
jgi:tetratricopeptide (TPR) repeat protein